MRGLLALGALLLFAAPVASAQQLVYTPTNPAFGGSPLNYSWLLNSAQVQNQHQATSSSIQRDPLADFEQSLQRQILNQLSRELIFGRFGDLDLTQPGTFDFGDFQVEITPGLGGVAVRIFNLLTGDETTVTIPGAP